MRAAIRIIGICFALYAFGRASYILITHTECQNKINALVMTNIILSDYKKLFIEHKEKCDTTHQHCFNTNISSLKISPVHTITSCNSQTIFCSSCGSRTISSNVGGMLTKADAG